MISFIILHYKNINDTIDCIKSINNIKSSKKKSIVIVDNNTLCEKEIDYLKQYTKDIIINDKNLGFAKGNNIGCKYAIKKYKPDFLCVINNDTLITQKNFIDEIYSCYEKTNFDMMGPEIITDNGDSVNPFYAYENIDEINSKIKYHKKLIMIYKSKILRNLLNSYIKIKRIFIKPKKLENGNVSLYNVALHGCAIIFSKKYYEKYNDIFYNGTFLYHEEEFLNYRKNRDKLITFYDKNLKIYHKEGSSLNESFKGNNYEKLIFRNSEIVKSLEELKRVIKNNKKI